MRSWFEVLSLIMIILTISITAATLFWIENLTRMKRFRQIVASLVVLHILSVPLSDLPHFIDACRDDGMSDMSMDTYLYKLNSGLAAQILYTAGVPALVLLLSFMVRTENMSILRRAGVAIWNVAMVLFGFVTLLVNIYSLANNFDWGEGAIFWALIRVYIVIICLIGTAVFILGYLYECVQGLTRWMRNRRQT
jgi:hypothetical protein